MNEDMNEGTYAGQHDQKTATTDGAQDGLNTKEGHTFFQSLSSRLSTALCHGLRAWYGKAQQLKRSLQEQERPVYDLINAGPNHRFLTSGPMVSNCTLGLGFSMSSCKFINSCESQGLVLDATPRDQWPEEFSFRTKFMLANGMGVYDPYDPKYEKEVGTFLASDKIVTTWRTANAKIVDFWHRLENAFRQRAVAGDVDIISFPLRSGRYKDYFHPAVKTKLESSYNINTGKQETRSREVLMASVIRDRPPVVVHGGPLAENIVQATARDIMAQSAVDIGEMYPQFKYLWNVYDEVIWEVEDKDVELANQVIPEMMCHGPSISKWIGDLPLVVEGGIFDHYCK